jgi:CheY-like chemotaxis protein/nitrogen-specific signal transduction histidine kinase
MTSHDRTVILNVDDNEGCRYAVTRILQLHDFAVHEAATGAEALRLARAEQPDLVLLDVNLPDMNGFEVCRRLKQEPATARIPVLHVTASYVDSRYMAMGLESGADSYLTEPVEPEVLLATINSVLRARRAERRSESMAREWQTTFDAMNDGVAVVDAEGVVQRSNASLSRLLGGAESGGLWELFPGARQPLIRALETRQRQTVELELENQKFSATVDPIRGEGNQAASAVLILSDITEKRQLEEQFRESQKFETIGTLAAGVAHDFNNLLTSIMGNASLALAELPLQSGLREKLEDVVRASERAADLTRQLLAYSGKDRHYMQTVELSKLVRGMENLLETAVPKKVTLGLHLAPHLPGIKADPNQVQQVILNLVTNAAEAIGDDTGSIVIRTGIDVDGFVYLEVRDTGCGMDADTKARIFDPFFTTKFTGRGLGLAAVAGVVRAHKAAVQVSSAPGEGSTFRILFAAVEESIPLKGQAAGAGGTTVLVVDDEDVVRRIAQATLELHGYPVLAATNGLEAVDMVRHHPEIGLVLLDLAMPVMGGEEAIDQIVALRPGIPVIVSTGYDQQEAVGRFAEKQVAGYLQKPYTSRQLAEKVRTSLTKAAGR